MKHIYRILTALILTYFLFKNNTKNKFEHKVTDSIIYWNGQQLINESP